MTTDRSADDFLAAPDVTRDEPKRRRVCRSSYYTDTGRRQDRGDREVRCSLDDGHAGDHEEHDDDGETLGSWPRRYTARDLLGLDPQARRATESELVEKLAAENARLRQQRDGLEEIVKRQQIELAEALGLPKPLHYAAMIDSVKDLVALRSSPPVLAPGAVIMLGEMAQRWRVAGWGSDPNPDLYRLTLVREEAVIPAGDETAPETAPVSTQDDGLWSYHCTACGHVSHGWTAKEYSDAAYAEHMRQHHPEHPPVGEGAALIAATEAKVAPHVVTDRLTAVGRLTVQVSSWEATARILAAALDGRPSTPDEAEPVRDEGATWDTVIGYQYLLDEIRKATGTAGATKDDPPTDLRPLSLVVADIRAARDAAEQRVRDLEQQLAEARRLANVDWANLANDLTRRGYGVSTNIPMSILAAIDLESHRIGVLRAGVKDLADDWHESWQALTDASELGEVYRSGERRLRALLGAAPSPPDGDDRLGGPRDTHHIEIIREAGERT